MLQSNNQQRRARPNARILALSALVLFVAMQVYLNIVRWTGTAGPVSHFIGWFGMMIVFVFGLAALVAAATDRRLR
jgi:hypothetical protein